MVTCVFHYTRCSTALEGILVEKHLRLNEYARTPDPKESKDWSFGVVDPSHDLLMQGFADINERANKYLKSNTKTLCTSADSPPAAGSSMGEIECSRGYARPRMWAQYGDKHTGVCLALDREVLANAIYDKFAPHGQVHESPVTYSNSIYRGPAFGIRHDHVRQEGLERALDRHIREFHRELYFTKALDWRDEQEWRWLIRTETAGFETIEVEAALRGIVIGVDCPGSYDPSFRALAKGLDVPAFRLLWANGLPCPILGEFVERPSEKYLAKWGLK